jgi:hypothetical protein
MDKDDYMRISKQANEASMYVSKAHDVMKEIRYMNPKLMKAYGIYTVDLNNLKNVERKLMHLKEDADKTLRQIR